MKQHTNKQLRLCRATVTAQQRYTQKDLEGSADLAPARRKVWEVDGGENNITRRARAQDLHARSFGLHNGWDFSRQNVQAQFRR